MSNIDSLSIKKVSAVAPKVPIITDNFEINDYETKDISTSSSVVNADGSINLDTFIDSVDIQDYETGEVQGSLGIKTTHQETEGEKKPWYEAALNFLEDTAATVVEVSTSFVKGIANVGEDIVDGVAMLGGNVVVAGATICNWAGADIDVEGIKEGVSDFVETEHINDLYDSTVGEWDWVQDNSYASDTALGIAEGVGTMVGYAAVSALPGAGGSIVAGLGAAGSASESAFQNGASFEGATVVGAVAFGAGTLADVGLDKIGAAAKGSKTVSDVIKWTGVGAAAGTFEPLANNTAQYLAYGRNMVDEEGNLLYDSSIGGFFDFAGDNGMWYDAGIGAAIGGGRSLITSVGGLKSNQAKGEIATLDADQSAIETEEISAYYEENPIEEVDDFPELAESIGAEEFADDYDLYGERARNEVRNEALFNYVKNSEDDFAQYIVKNYKVINESNASEFIIVSLDENGAPKFALDWPKYAGYDLNTIESLETFIKGKPNGDFEVSRTGGDYGHAIGTDITSTNSQRSVPALSQNGRAGIFHGQKYLNTIDTISKHLDTNGVAGEAAVEALMESGMDQAVAMKMVSEYNGFKDLPEIGQRGGLHEVLPKSKQSIYGYAGKAAPWTTKSVKMVGGAGQMNTIFSWGTLVEAGIIDGESIKEIEIPWE